MKMPGFTAESSLYRASGHYAVSIGDTANIKQGITTALSGSVIWNPPQGIKCALACGLCNSGDYLNCEFYEIVCGNVYSDCNPPQEIKCALACYLCNQDNWGDFLSCEYYNENCGDVFDCNPPMP